ncbi:uncharacterized protein LOC116202859 isoform X2 [Punica granatum]|uniref:Uncharacterized protein LOC116202859 isoform X2 n=1 Tax=Punica granatum TaxID=22663 RepID=A0A6P8D1T0_PUNGR|nr:uncharacterized protein LOC116202859 isoform X2 [Punica granatum]
MVNIFRANTFLRGVMKLVGLRPQKIEIEPGTVMNIWAPTRTSDKPAVVLLHGFSLDGIHTWQFHVPSLAGKYSVYVPDFMFFGSSTTDRPERSVAFQAQCVDRALKRLGVGRCIVAGFSYGGIVSFELARTCPELVESLVVCGSVMTLTESITADFFRRMGNDGLKLSGWSDLLLPDSAKGARTTLEIGTYMLPQWIPDCIFRQYQEVMSEHIKEKAELLEALVIPDDEDPNKISTLSQKIGRKGNIGEHREGRSLGNVGATHCLQSASKESSRLSYRSWGSSSLPIASKKL